MEDTQKDAVQPTNETSAQDMGTSSASVTESQKGGAMKWIVGVIIVVALLGGAYYYYTQMSDDTDNVAVGGIAIPDGPVARVNGEEITSEEYAAVVNELSQAATGQGLSLSDVAVQSRIKDEALMVLINTELLTQEAEEAGITTSKESISTELAALETQLGGKEALASALTAYGLTQEQLRKNITTQLTIEAYLSETLAIEVTEEEVQALYDQVAASTEGELPALADIRAEVEAQIQATKTQPLAEALITSLREEAEIEVLI